MYRFSHFGRDIRASLFGAVISKKYKLTTLGERSTACHWTFNPEGLNSESVVISGGVGRDITFEHALAKEFGCKVVLFDPSPTGVETMSLPANQIDKFKFLNVGLAGKSGTLHLSPPLRPDEGPWFSTGNEGSIEVPCFDLQTLLKKSGHDHVDLLKLDIEGCEYGVLEYLTTHRIPVRQICVEYHHGILPGCRRTQTAFSILKMLLHGYKVLDQSGSNVTFYKP